MAVTVAGFVESVRTDTSDPMTWSHNSGTASPQGVLVAIMHGTSSTDHVVSVTYGSKSLAFIQRNVDTTTEPGAASWWFAGEGIPTGTQTVTVELSSGTTDDIHGVSITLDGDRDLSILHKDGVDGNTANPSVALTNSSGSSAMSFAAMYSGLSTIASLAAGADCTLFTTSELAGNFCSACVRQTTASTANFTVAVTSATDDVAFSAVMVQENPVPPVPTSYASRFGSLAAIWSAVVITPLLASALYTGVVPETPPPPLNNTLRAVVHESWRPPDWSTQYTRKVAYSGPEVAIPQVPFSRASSVPIPQWPQDDWSTQTPKKIYIPDAKDPWSRSPSTPIAIWPQDEWPTQSTRKVSTTGPEVYPMPKTDWGQIIIRQWPQDEWPSQSTRKVSATGPEVYPVSRTEWGQRIVQSWPQSEWDSQFTRKAPIPDAVIDNPPPYRNFGAVYARWDATDILPLWQSAGYQDGPTVGSGDNPPFSSRHDALNLLVSTWPQPDWAAQQAPPSAISGPSSQVDNPPPKRPIPDAILSSWEPRPLQPVWYWRLMQDVPHPFRRDVLPIILDSWQVQEWPTQRTKKVTASGPEAVQPQPFDHPAFKAISVWEPITWPTQTTRKVRVSTTKHWLFRNHTNTLGAGFQHGANQ